MRLYDYGPSGNCYKVRLLLAVLDREYERVPVDIFAGDTLTEGFARLNPARETPVLELDDGQVLVQSNAILWYLATGTEFLPAEPVMQARVAQWLFLEQERIMATIGAARFFTLTGRFPKQIGPRVARGREALDLLDGRLERSAFLASGRPTIADVSVYAYAHKAPDVGLDLAEWPGVSEWMERIEALPGFLDDYVAYPSNARPGVSRSIYDAA